MSVPSWIEDPDLWDEIYVGDAYFNETNVDVEGTPFGNELEVKKGNGADGATNKDKGYVPWKPKLSILIYSQEHWVQYDVLLQLYQPKPGKTGSPVVRITHPIFDLYKKNRFKIEKLHPIRHIGEGKWIAAFDLLEHFDAPKPQPKPKPNGDQQPAGSRRERLGLEYELNKPSAKPKP
jgi:hypothetical protein